MRLIRTETLTPTTKLDPNEANYIYNGLDTMLTFEVFEEIVPQLSPVTAETYAFSRALQAPILEMNARGVRIDTDRRNEVIASYRRDMELISANLNRLLREGIGWDFDVPKTRKNSWPSPKQVCELLYDVMQLPAIKKRNSEGEMRPTAERAALEKLEHYFYAEPIIKHLLSLGDIAKKVQFLTTDIDSDGRIRTSFNIAGTNTGRLASAYSDFGTGTNLQNVENRLRSVFVADPGYKFCNVDLEQGDSRGVGAILWNLFRNDKYLNACESGDLHTTVARLGFPHLDWCGDGRLDRNIADTRFYREHSYRDAAKRLGHGTNYRGAAEHMSKMTHIPIEGVRNFVSQYLKAFPLEMWWDWVEKEITHKGKLTTLAGRQRIFFGHPRERSTINEAVAFEPQSITSDTINRGLLALWRSNSVQILLQVHDSILFQYPEEKEDEIIPSALALIEQHYTLKGGRPFSIPAEAKVGWNWSNERDDPDALRKFGDDKRPRQRTRKPSSNFLDSRLS